MAGGVAAAFSVRLTADADGLRDALDRAVRLHRGAAPRQTSAGGEMLGLYPVGFLAHSHAWTAPGSTPLENVTARLEALADELVRHSREFLDLVCIADVSSWDVGRLPSVAFPRETTPTSLGVISGREPGQADSVTPVGAFLTALLRFLSYDDPLVQPLYDGLLTTNTSGTGSGRMRRWPLEEVFSEHIRAQVAMGPRPGDNKWGRSPDTSR